VSGNGAGRPQNRSGAVLWAELCQALASTPARCPVCMSAPVGTEPRGVAIELPGMDTFVIATCTTCFPIAERGNPLEYRAIGRRLLDDAQPQTLAILGSTDLETLLGDIREVVDA